MKIGRPHIVGREGEGKAEEEINMKIVIVLKKI